MRVNAISLACFMFDLWTRSWSRMALQFAAEGCVPIVERERWRPLLHHFDGEGRRKHQQQTPLNTAYPTAEISLGFQSGWKAPSSSSSPGSIAGGACFQWALIPLPFLEPLSLSADGRKICSLSAAACSASKSVCRKSGDVLGDRRRSDRWVDGWTDGGHQ